MPFTRKIQLSASHASDPATTLYRIERHLQRRDFKPKRQEKAVVLQLFSWSELLSAKEADRFSWDSVTLEHQDGTLRLDFKYNWILQAFAHFAMTIFVTAFMNRFGNPEAIIPMIASMNLALGMCSFVWAYLYAGKFTAEIAEIASDERAPAVWGKSA